MGLFGVSMQLGGCQSDTTGLSDELQVQAPVSTDRNLVYEDRTHDELVFVSAIEDALNVRREVIGTEDDVIAWKRPTVDRDALLLMNVAVDAKQEDVVEQLIRIDSNTLIARFMMSARPSPTWPCPATVATPCSTSDRPPTPSRCRT